jgi:hypothetical protein
MAEMTLAYVIGNDFKFAIAERALEDSFPIPPPRCNWPIGAGLMFGCS